MLNQKFKLEGNYYKDTGHRIRLQLNLMGLGDTDSKMLQVCDGKILWDFQQVLGMQSYRKREITPILKKLEDPNLDDGVPDHDHLEHGLRRPRGDAVRPEEGGRVRPDFRGEARDGVERRASSEGPGGTERPCSARTTGRCRRPPPCPPTSPRNVAIYVGKLDGWPYKIEMIGNAPSLAPGGHPGDRPRHQPPDRPAEEAAEGRPHAGHPPLQAPAAFGDLAGPLQLRGPGERRCDQRQGRHRGVPRDARPVHPGRDGPEEDRGRQGRRGATASEGQADRRPDAPTSANRPEASPPPKARCRNKAGIAS